MILNLPVCYQAEIRNGSGDWVRRTLMRTVSVDIAEVHASDCMIAAENIDFGSGSRFVSIWHEDAHWIRETPSAFGFGRTYLEKFDPECPAHAYIMAQGHAWRNHLKGCSGVKFRDADGIAYGWVERGMPEHSRFAKKESRRSTFEQEVRRLKEYRQNVRIIDGYLYRRVPTPYFRIDNGLVSVSVNSKLGPWGGFSLDRREDLQSHLEHLLNGTGTGLGEGPVVHLPDTFRWNDEEASFDRAVDEVKKFISYSGTDGYGDRQRANGCLARTLMRMEKQGSYDRDELADDMTTFAKVHYPARLGSTEMAARTFTIIQVVDAAVSRWRMRPLEIDPPTPGM